MRWALWNGMGAGAWLAGLTFAKGAPLPQGNPFGADDHQFILGVTCGVVGIAALLWANLKSPA